MSILRTPSALSQLREHAQTDAVSPRIHRLSHPSLRWGRSFLVASALVAMMALGWLGAANASSALSGQASAQYASAAASHMTMRPACVGVPFPCE